MAVIRSDLQLASFNCKGLSNGIPVISDLLQSHDICLIQEHWHGAKSHPAPRVLLPMTTTEKTL